MMRKRNPTRTVLCVETLEDRCLLSGGVLDPTFGNGGFVTTDFGSNIDEVRAVAVAGDVKIVAGGATFQGRGGGNWSDFGVVRYLPNGALDGSFGTGGKVTTVVGNKSSLLADVAVQPDGKILAAGEGNEDFALVRYNTSGSVDASFGGKANGKVLTDITAKSTDHAMAMVLQVDGRIVLAGVANTDLALVRYKSDGSLDPTFDQDGKKTLRLPSLVSLAKDSMEVIVYPPTSASHAGKIVVVTGNYVLRFNPDGSLDTSFGAGNGYVTLAAAWIPSVAIQSDGRILVARSIRVGGREEITLTRLQTDGTLDASFGTAGIVTTSLPMDKYAHAVMVQADGKILVAGRQVDTLVSANYFFVARFSPLDGSLDTTFGVNGVATTTAAVIDSRPVVDLALQPDGRIVVAGTTYSAGNLDFALARFLATGPQIGSFTASPSAVTAGSPVTLTASNITDANPGSTTTQVGFYVDSNGNGVLDSGDTLLVGSSNYSNGTWTLTFSTTGWSSGSHKLFTQALDSYGVFSDPLALDLDVL